MSKEFLTIDSWECAEHPGPLLRHKGLVGCYRSRMAGYDDCLLIIGDTDGQHIAHAHDGEEYVDLGSGVRIHNRKWGVQPEYWHLLGGEADRYPDGSVAYLLSLVGPVPFDADASSGDRGQAIMDGIDLEGIGPSLVWLKTWARKPSPEEVAQVVATRVLHDQSNAGGGDGGSPLQ